MNKKEFLEQNKIEIAKLITEINKNNDDALSDYLMERVIEIVTKSKKDIDLNTIKEKLIKAAKELEDDNNYFDEELDTNNETPVYVEDDRQSLDALQQYRRDIERFPLLTPEQEKELFIRYKNGDQSAKELIINSNLRLVMKIAGKYKINNIQLLDLIQEGNMGLQKAVERFDVNRGNKLSTYATWWIRQYIKRIFPDMSLQYRIPVHIEENKCKIIRAEREIYYDKGREATLEEVASLTGIDENEILRIKMATTQAASLHKPVNEEEDTELGDMIADDKQSVEDVSIHSQLHDDIMAMLERDLNERERDIIIARYGLLNGDGGRTLQVVSKDYNVTRERIRQIECKALHKLRRKEKNTGLIDYLN